MKIKFATNQLIAIFIEMVITIINIVLILVMTGEGKDYTNSEITFLSWCALVEFVVAIIVWKMITDEIICPFMCLYFCAFAFCLSQTCGWALNIDIGEKNLLEYIPLDIHSLGKGIIFSINGLNALLFGAIFSYRIDRRNISNASTKENEFTRLAINKIAGVLLVVSFPIYAIYMLIELKYVAIGGYMTIYRLPANLTRSIQILDILSNWFSFALLMKYIIYASEHSRKRYVFSILILISVVPLLIIGGRSGAVSVILSLVIARIYFSKPINMKQFIPSAMGIYLFADVLNVIRETRGEAGRSVVKFISNLFVGTGNVFGQLIGESGWNLSSIEWTMMLIDPSKAFRYGITYLASFLTIVPNLGFWDVHPAEKHVVGDFLQTNLHRTTGLGYTFIAEAYLNFGWFGIVFIFVLGYILGRWLAGINRYNAKYNYFYSLIIIMCLSALLKSFVRSSFDSIMRDFFYSILPVIIMIKVYCSRLQKK